jgi:hypothetical protein
MRLAQEREGGSETDKSEEKLASTELLAKRSHALEAKLMGQLKKTRPTAEYTEQVKLALASKIKPHLI